MRVVIVGEYPLDSTQIRGGVEAAFAYLVKGLAQIDDLQLHIFTLKKDNGGEPEQVEENGVTLHLLPSFPRFERVRNYQTYQSVLNKKLAQINPKLVHAQNAGSHAYVTLRSSYPAIVTAHGVRREDGKYYGSFGRRVRSYFDSLIIERYIMSHTRHLIAISRYVTDYFASQLRPDTEVYYIPNAIDSNFFDLASDSSGQTVLFAGRVIPRKCVLELVQAFARVVQQAPSAQLRIAGEYNSEKDYADSVRDCIQKEHLEDHVHLLGPLAEDAVLCEFANCDVLALPSAQETSPMVIAQAMAAAKPVVATPVGGVAEMVNNDRTGLLVDVGDVDGLADALLRLLVNPSLRIDMGQAGHKFALENYHAHSVARRTCEVYQKMVSTG